MQKRRLRNRNGVFFWRIYSCGLFGRHPLVEKLNLRTKKNRLQTLRLEANPKIHTHQADKKPPTGMSIIMRLLFATAFFRAFFCGSFFCGSFQCAFACAFLCGSRFLCRYFFCGSRLLCGCFFSGRFLCYGFLCGSRFLCHYFFCNRLFCGSFFCYFFCCHDFYVFWFIYSHCPSGRKH